MVADQPARTAPAPARVGTGADARGGAQPPSSGVLRLRAEPVEDPAHHPARLRLLDVGELGLVEEDAVAGEADVDRHAPVRHLVHLHAALRAAHPVEGPEPLPLGLLQLQPDVVGQLPLPLGVLADEVLVLERRGDHGLCPGALEVIRPAPWGPLPPAPPWAA